MSVVSPPGLAASKNTCQRSCTANLFAANALNLGSGPQAFLFGHSSSASFQCMGDASCQQVLADFTNAALAVWIPTSLPETPDAWTTTDDLPAGHFEHTAALLNNGQVLLVGGEEMAENAATNEVAGSDGVALLDRSTVPHEARDCHARKLSGNPNLHARVRHRQPTASRTSEHSTHLT